MGTVRDRHNFFFHVI